MLRNHHMPAGKSPAPYTAWAARRTPIGSQQHVDVRELRRSSIRRVSPRLYSQTRDLSQGTSRDWHVAQIQLGRWRSRPPSQSIRCCGSVTSCWQSCPQVSKRPDATDSGRMINDHWSLVIGHWSLVIRRYPAATLAYCAIATSGSSISACHRFSHSKLYNPR